MEEKILKVLNELEALKKGEINYWNIPKTSAEFLNKLTALAMCKRVLEIGTSNGYSGIYLAEALSHNGGLLYTIESHAARFKLAAENFEKAGLENFIKQIFGHAPEVLSELDGSWDLIFIDATKMEYKSYLDILLPGLKVGGLIVADNCLTHKSELAEFFKYIENIPSLKSMLLPYDNGLLISVKTL